MLYYKYQICTFEVIMGILGKVNFIFLKESGFVRRFVTTLLKQDTSKSSLKQKRKEAGWDTSFLEKLLFG